MYAFSILSIIFFSAFGVERACHEQVLLSLSFSSTVAVGAVFEFDGVHAVVCFVVTSDETDVFGLCYFVG